MNNVDALKHYRIWEINKKSNVEEFRAIPSNKDVILWMEKLDGRPSHREEEFK